MFNGQVHYFYGNFAIYIVDYTILHHIYTTIFNYTPISITNFIWSAKFRLGQDWRREVPQEVFQAAEMGLEIRKIHGKRCMSSTKNGKNHGKTYGFEMTWVMKLYETIIKQN